MASYSLMATTPTVQVLSPTLVQDVIYTTIITSPSQVIANIPIYEQKFDAGLAGPQLTDFANAIEQIMADSRVIAGEGVQTIDPSGLLQDQVAFTVEYVVPTAPPGSVVADALVRVNLLNFADAEIGRILLAQVEAIIDKTYSNLQSAASG